MISLNFMIGSSAPDRYGWGAARSAITIAATSSSGFPHGYDPRAYSKRRNRAKVNRKPAHAFTGIACEARPEKRTNGPPYWVGPDRFSGKIRRFRRFFWGSHTMSATAMLTDLRAPA